ERLGDPDDVPCVERHVAIECGVDLVPDERRRARLDVHEVARHRELRRVHQARPRRGTPLGVEPRVEDARRRVQVDQQGAARPEERLDVRRAGVRQSGLPAEHRWVDALADVPPVADDVVTGPGTVVKEWPLVLVQWMLHRGTGAEKLHPVGRVKPPQQVRDHARERRLTRSVDALNQYEYHCIPANLVRSDTNLGYRPSSLCISSQRWALSRVSAATRTADCSAASSPAIAGSSVRSLLRSLSSATSVCRNDFTRRSAESKADDAATSAQSNRASGAQPAIALAPRLTSACAMFAASEAAMPATNATPATTRSSLPGRLGTATFST